LSQQQEKATAPATSPPNFESWREEIEAFCRQTVAYLQSLLDLAEEDQAQPPLPVAGPSPEPVARTPVERTAATSTPAPRDLDASQDRLANLKRQLAAKLSHATKDDRPS
jgi:hypothetical protein